MATIKDLFETLKARKNRELGFNLEDDIAKQVDQTISGMPAGTSDAALVTQVNNLQSMTQQTNQQVQSLAQAASSATSVSQQAEAIHNAINARIDQLKTKFEDIDLIPGPKGDQGIQGDQGLRGLSGSQGSQGERGLQGPQGIPGNDGKDGPEGRVGPAGPQGLPGNQGAKGESGESIKGEKGDKGDQGIQGIPGIQGSKGDPGQAGSKGEQGLKGDTGLKGSTGDKGADGTMAYKFGTNAVTNGKMYLATGATDATGNVVFTIPAGFFTTVNSAQPVVVANNDNHYTTYIKALSATSVTVKVAKSASTVVLLLNALVPGLVAAEAGVVVHLLVLGT